MSNMPNNKGVRTRPSTWALRASRRWINPLLGDYIQSVQVRQLARIIDEEHNEDERKKIEAAWKEVDEDIKNNRSRVALP